MYFHAFDFFLVFDLLDKMDGSVKDVENCECHLEIGGSCEKVIVSFAKCLFLFSLVYGMLWT